MIKRVIAPKIAIAVVASLAALGAILTLTGGGVVTLGTDIVIDDNGNGLRMIAISP